MRFPVFWLAVAYAAGLAAFADVDDSPRILLALAATALLAGAAALRRRWQATTLLGVLAGAFLLGGATIRLDELSVEAHRVDRLLAAGPLDLSEAVRLAGWLRRAPERKPFATFYELELETIEAAGRRWTTSGGVRLSYFPRNEAQAPPPPLPSLRYGDRVEVLAPVHEPISRQNRGSFDWRTYLGRQGIFLVGTLRDPALLTRLPGRRGWRGVGWIEQLRVRLLERLDTLVPPHTQGDRNAVLRAMLLGDTGFLSHRVADDFRLSGAYHVLVVSGLNVAILAFWVFWPLRRLGCREWAATLLTIPVLVIYLLLVEDRPPVERAVWMVSLYLVARLLFRQVHLANPTSLAVLLVLFLHPQWIFESSFHLSFAAVLLIAFFALPWTKRTTAPYRHSLSFLDTPERLEQLREPRLVQFRYDLRALAELLAPLAFWSKERDRAALRLLTGVVRLALRAVDFFLLSLAIQLGFVALIALYFDRVVFVGLLTNILVIPLVGVIVPVGLTTLLLALVGQAVAALPALVLSWSVQLLLWVVEFTARYGLSYGIPPPPLWVAVLYLGSLAVLAAAVERQWLPRWRNAAALALALLILVVVTHPFPPQLDPQGLEITVLDVGQGDSLLVTFPNRETWLVDGGRGPVEVRPGYRIGEEVGEAVVVPYLRARGLKRLDRVWLTHAHHDHMAGLHFVVEELPVGSFHVGSNPASPSYRRLLERLERRRIPLERHAGGEKFAVGDVGVEVLWPPRNHQPGPEPSNNDSLVLRLCLPAPAGLVPTCVLLPGDIEDDVEKKLAQQGAPLAAAALKVPHHGGRGAATPEFLAAVNPQVAIISAGGTSPFSHPRPEVLERLRAQAAQVYRTDREGSVTVRVEASGLSVASYRQQQRRHPYPNLGAKLAACARRLVLLQSK